MCSSRQILASAAKGFGASTKSVPSCPCGSTKLYTVSSSVQCFSPVPFLNLEHEHVVCVKKSPMMQVSRTCHIRRQVTFLHKVTDNRARQGHAFLFSSLVGKLPFSELKGCCRFRWVHTRQVVPRDDTRVWKRPERCRSRPWLDSPAPGFISGTSYSPAAVGTLLSERH